MTICEAIKCRTEAKPYITRKAWAYDLPDVHKPEIKVYPTATPDCCLLVSMQSVTPRRGWQPIEQDLVAEDWIITE